MIVITYRCRLCDGTGKYVQGIGDLLLGFATASIWLWHSDTIKCKKCCGNFKITFKINDNNEAVTHISSPNSLPFDKQKEINKILQEIYKDNSKKNTSVYYID